MQDGVVIYDELDYDTAFDYFVIHGAFANKSLVIERDGYFDQAS
jgi:hypothetical protein